MRQCANGYVRPKSIQGDLALTAAFTAAPGSTVVVRDEDWLVSAVEPTTDGFLVHVVGLSELVRDTEATFSTALDEIIESDPSGMQVKSDDSDGYRKTKLWLEAMLRKTPVPIADPELTVASGGLADTLNYQLKAVRQALDPDNLRPRILLADAVGLGKTLEIGMILAELVRRGRGERILVVTPKHVLEQFQMEMWTRFALPFVRLDSAGIQRIRRELPANRNPFTYYKRVIISIDTLKSDKYIAHLRKQRWDAVVIDESHNVTNTMSQNNRLARLLASRSDALILASATPHNGKAESFAELIRMLEPSAVKADGSIDEEQVKRLIIRRHRHHPDVKGEVGSDWAERLEPRNVMVPASPIENEIAHELNDVWLHPKAGGAPTTVPLFPWTLAKAFLSSPAALVQSCKERLKRHSGPAEENALTRLLTLADQAESGKSAKYDALLGYLTKIGVKPGTATRAVVFAERVATLGWLQRRLMKDLKLTKEQVKILHGGLSDQEQQEIVESFKLESSPIRVLVTGDVASEGVNLHSQCHHLIHFDIPWSLIRIEQRNGRIDRYGQKHRPEITTLLLEPDTDEFAGDIRVLTRLIEREHEAHKALGDSASLIGTYDVTAEENAIRDVLARKRDLDDVVKTVAQAQAAGGMDGLLARLLSLPTQPATSMQSAVRRGGLYASEIDYLSDALDEFLKTPGQEPPNGVAWRKNEQHKTAQLRPPKDLKQRLQLLPQSYLASRKVTELFKLAFTVPRGQQELAAARSGESTSAWPEAHFLAPLHPIIDWASDRALAELGRNEVFAVRGHVSAPTVLTQATLTNSRGQVVACSYINVEFPFGLNGFAHPHPSAQEAIDHLKLSSINSGEIDDVDQLQPLVANAVKSAEVVVAGQIEAIKVETRDRIKRWVERSARWEQEASALVQRKELKDRKAQVSDEAKEARKMNPDRTLIRPLLVVIPSGSSVADLLGEIR